MRTRKRTETVDLLVWLANVFDGDEIERETLRELSATNDGERDIAMEKMHNIA